MLELVLLRLLFHSPPLPMRTVEGQLGDDTNRVVRMSKEAFALLGVKPQLGRAFDPEDHRVGFTQEVLISDGFWQRGFCRDPRVLGKSVRLDTDLYRIIGVTPPGFRAPWRIPDERDVDVWAATSFSGPPLPDRPPRNRRNIPAAIARLGPGLTLAAATRTSTSPGPGTGSG